MPSAEVGAQSSSVFPLGSFKDAAKELRRPFAVEAVRFKVQATFPKSDPTGALIVSYIDARLVVERLNLIVPHLWHDDYQEIERGLMLCRLTVDGITRMDVGEGIGKAGFSDALKRAAVKFGVGVSLYATPTQRLKVDDGALRRVQTSKGPTLVMTSQGERRAREVYGAWLRDHGEQAFGEALSHGDVADAQGDVEVDAAVDTVSSALTPEPVGLDDETLDRVLAEFRVAKPTIEMLRERLIDLGVESVPAAAELGDGPTFLGMLRGLTSDQAAELMVWLGELVADVPESVG